jgi:hypothetical protein
MKVIDNTNEPRRAVTDLRFVANKSQENLSRFFMSSTSVQLQRASGSKKEQLDDAEKHAGPKKQA